MAWLTLGLALPTLPLGTAYTVWTGIGTIGTAQSLLLQAAGPQMQYVGGGPAKGAVIIVTSTLMYVLPTLLAFKRERRRKGRIMAINLLLGWTLIGWVVAVLMTYAYEPPAAGAPPDTERVPGTPRF